MTHTLHFNSSEGVNNKYMKKRPTFASWSKSFMRNILEVDNKTNSYNRTKQEGSLNKQR